jgi:tetratricopeptide (TPR) repeat protein
MAQADEDQGLYERAVRDYRAVLQRFPDSRPALAGLGRSLACLGRCRDAAAVFDRLPVSDSADREALLGACHFRLREFEPAITNLEKAVRGAPRKEQARILLARSYAAVGRYAEAIGSLEAWTRQNGADPDSLYWIGKFYEDLANRTFEQLAARNPAEPQVYETQGDQYLAKGEYEKALEAYKKALASSPGAPPGLHFNLGNIYWRTLRLEDARKELEAELKINPYHAQANYELGDISAKQGKAEEAVPYLEKALALDPGLVEAHRALGRALVFEKHYARAVKEFLAVAAAEPSDHTIHAVLASTYRLMGRLEDAKRESRRSEELERESAKKEETNREAQRKLGELPPRE